jgi:hypothetical protein
MVRKCKALGLALIAMFALSAFVAQGASAVPLTVELPAGQKNAFYTGDQGGGLHEFTTPNGSVKCTTAVFAAKTTVESTVNEITISPSYSGCSAFGFATAHVKPNGCTYTFTTPTTIDANTVTWHPEQIHIVCSGENKIEITPTSFGVSVCTQFVGTQTPTKGHVVGKNVEKSSPMDILLEVTLEGIHYTGTGGICGNSETHSDAIYKGNSTVKCYKNEAHTEQVGCTFSP